MGNLGVIICLSQGGLHSPSASSSYLFNEKPRIARSYDGSSNGFQWQWHWFSNTRMGYRMGTTKALKYSSGFQILQLILNDIIVLFVDNNEK